MKSKKMMSKSDLLLSLLEDAVFTSTNMVSRQEILNFTQEHDIDLREDHLEFLMKYGDAPFFKRGFEKGISFEGFQDYYIEEANNPHIKEENLLHFAPPGILYFGHEDIFPLTLSQETGGIGEYSETCGFENFYLNIKSFLFSRLSAIDYLFDKSGQYNFSLIEEAEAYRKEHEKYRLVDIEDYQYDYYFHNNTLMALKKGPSTYYKKYVGGVLNQFEEK